MPETIQLYDQNELRHIQKYYLQNMFANEIFYIHV